MSATAEPLRLATYDRDGRWAAALGMPGGLLVDAAAAQANGAPTEAAKAT